MLYTINIMINRTRVSVFNIILMPTEVSMVIIINLAYQRYLLRHSIIWLVMVIRDDDYHINNRIRSRHGFMLVYQFIHGFCVGVVMHEVAEIERTPAALGCANNIMKSVQRVEN